MNIDYQEKSLRKKLKSLKKIDDEQIEKNPSKQLDTVIVKSSELDFFKTRIKQLEFENYNLRRDKEITINSLLERIKELELQLTGERPNTARVATSLSNKNISEGSECAICNEYLQPYEIVEHLLLCGRSPDTCEVCGESFNKSELAKHLNEMTSSEVLI